MARAGRGFPSRRNRFLLPNASGGTTYTVSLAGTLSSSGAMAKVADKVLAGTLSSSGAVAKLVEKSLSGTLTDSGSIAKAVSKSFAGGLPSSGVLAKQAQKSLAGGLTSSGSLAKAIDKALAGGLTSSGTLAKTIDKALAGALTSSGSLAKAIDKALAGVLASSGTYTGAKSRLVSLLATAILRKSITLSSLSLGSNNVADIIGGAIRIEEISLRVTTAAGSGGLATLEFGNVVNATQFASSTPVAALTAGIQIYAASPTGMVATGPAPTIQNSVGSANIIATVGTAVFTAGVVEMVVIYTTFTAGATLS